MPSFRRAAAPRRVAFEAEPSYSRPARDDEAYVMRRFARHAARCPHACADPLAAYRGGRPFCPKGLRRARDVAQYVYALGGADGAYSLVDREGGARQRVRIEIPPGCEPAVRGLLRAMQLGLADRAPAPEERPQQPRSYDRTYDVAPRRPRVVRVAAPEDYYRPRAAPAESLSSVDAAAARDARLRSYRGKGSGMARERAEQAAHARARPPVYYRVRGGEAVPLVPLSSWT